MAKTKSIAHAYVAMKVYEQMIPFYEAYGLDHSPPEFELEPEPEWSLED